MTVEVCLGLAKAAGYVYAALQQRTYCYGGNDITAFAELGNCNAPCGGDVSRMCGGSCTNAIYLANGTGTQR
jgi:hypothetical protein